MVRPLFKAQSTFSLCLSDLSGEPLRDPVTYDGKVVERGMFNLKGIDGLLHDPTAFKVGCTPPPVHLPALLRRTAGRETCLTMLNATVEVPPVLIPSLVPTNLAVAIKMANVELPIHAPLSLTQGVITPALTLDEAGLNSVYISRGDPCGPSDKDLILLRPCNGGEVGVDPNVVSPVDEVFPIGISVELSRSP